MSDIEKQIKIKEAELGQLKEVAEFNRKVETRGRKLKYDEPMTEHFGFSLTKTQSVQLRKTLNDEKISISTFIRRLIFGD